MAQEATKEKKIAKKKTLPTNCAGTKARIRRATWYYKNGNYYGSKAAAKTHQLQLAEEKQKKIEEAKQAALDAAEKAKAAEVVNAEASPEVNEPQDK